MYKDDYRLRLRDLVYFLESLDQEKDVLLVDRMGFFDLSLLSVKETDEHIEFKIQIAQQPDKENTQ
jgi:hypothetical protein